jgi:hypothetical protein
MNWYKLAQNNGISVWLDDVRDPNNSLIQKDFGAKSGMIWAKTANEAINLLKSNNVTFMSFDHDLGEGNGSGYEVAVFVEEMAYNGSINRFEWRIHSMNKVGANNIRIALTNADKFWNERDKNGLV